MAAEALTEPPGEARFVFALPGSREVAPAVAAIERPWDVPTCEASLRPGAPGRRGGATRR